MNTVQLHPTLATWQPERTTLRHRDGSTGVFLRWESTRRGIIAVVRFHDGEFRERPSDLRLESESFDEIDRKEGRDDG